MASVFIRGTNSNHVLVLRDGMPITDASDPTGAFNFGIDTLSDIERIEVIRGPMAALYGSGAIGGVINLISRRGTEPGIHWSGDLAGGYPALIRGSVTASGVEGPVDFALTAEVAVAARLRLPFRSDRASIAACRKGSATGSPTLNLGYTPVEGTRLSLFLRARSAYFGFDTSGQPDIRRLQLQRPDDIIAGSHRRHDTLFDGRLESGLFVGQPAGRPAVPGAAGAAGSEPGVIGFAISRLSHRRAVEQHAASGRSDEAAGTAAPAR